MFDQLTGLTIMTWIAGLGIAVIIINLVVRIVVGVIKRIREEGEQNERL